MCGIAGFIETSDRRECLAPMLVALRHRGPDGEGAHFSKRNEWSVALGHRRLSIIDLEDGVQPMGNEDNSVWITYNGEVYNFLELREDLIAKGHQFRTRSDTESIVHHLEEHGSAGLADLNGMFAFALWNQNDGTLLLARDRAGIKPLYYASLADGGIVFASELTALLKHPGLSACIDSQALTDYFFCDYVPPPRTMVEGVRKLAPGAHIVWREGRLSEPQLYWTGEEAEEGDHTGEKDLARGLAERLELAVRRQLVSDVPLGVFLSGGIDSSIVAAMAARASKDRIRTFSIGFEDPSFDESRFARRVADHIGSEHVEQTFSESMVIDVLDEALDCLDEPMADPSILPTYLLSRLTAEHVKVVLGGDGGDELWGGYPTYKAHRYAQVYQRIPRWGRGLISGAVSRLPVNHDYMSFEFKAKRFALRWDDDERRRHFRWMSGVDLGDLPKLFEEDLELEPSVLVGGNGSLGVDPVNRLLDYDFRNYLPGSVLTKVDRASMACGLETRPPMLDNDFVDWSRSRRGRWKMRAGTGKYLLKEMAVSHLPESIVYRRKKGFGIPLATWMLGVLRSRIASVLEDSPAWEMASLSCTAFSSLAKEHWGRRRDWSKPLWALLALDHCLRRMG